MPASFTQRPTWQETAEQMRSHRDATIRAIVPTLPELNIEELPLIVTRSGKDNLDRERA